MGGAVIGIGLGALVGFLLYFVNATSAIKGDNIIIKVYGKKTIIPIQEVVSVVYTDMIRSYQAKIQTRTDTYYVTFGYDLDAFTRKIHSINPNVKIKENTLAKKR